MEQETLQKKKKKKKRAEQLLGIEEDYVTEESAKKIIFNIEERIIKVMSSHIGIENAISTYDLFVYIFGVSPSSVELYKRVYWWNIIKKVLRRLRSENKLYTVYRGSRIFTLKTNEELEMEKKRIDSHIHSLKNLKENAKDWVKKEMWKKL